MTQGCYKYLIIFITLSLALYCYYKRTTDFCTKKPYSVYTHVIVGAGTTGCVLAARLTENPNNKVLLIEAGSNFNYFSRVPLLNTFLQKSSYDWSYETEPQQRSSAGFHDKKQFLARGKGLGGSGQLNFMIHKQIDDVFYKSFQDIGAYELTDRIFRRARQTRINDYFNYVFMNNSNKYPSCKKRRTGYYHTHLQRASSQLSQVIWKAVSELDVPGLKYEACISTIHEGRRWSTYNSHLLPAAGRANLHILCHAQATQIITKNRRAIGVQTFRANQHKLQTFYATSDVILTAGAIDTPKLLLLSGLGDKLELEKLNISTVVDSPGVGLNLHDHFNVPLYISIEKPLSLTIKKLLSPRTFYDYLLHGRGPLSQSPIPGIVKLGDDVNLIIFGMGSVEKNVMCSIANYKPETFDSVFPFHADYSKEGLTVLAGCTRPKSRGYLKLRTNNFYDAPVIDPQYLHDNSDINCTIKALKLVEILINTTGFRQIGAKIHWPELEECKMYQRNPISNCYLECTARTIGLTLYHQAGTCKMGRMNDTSAVTDYNFQLKGLNGLRIVDASILPDPVPFPNAALIAIAQYASEII